MYLKKSFNKQSIMFILILLISNISLGLSWDYNKGGDDWESSCQTGPQAPIDISKPFIYRPTNLTFAYSNMMTEYSFFHDGNNLILAGDFGHMLYNGDMFFSTQVLFFSPSMHTVGNNHFPLEMQITHFNTKGEMVTVCVLFKKSDSDYSLLLGKLNFDQEELQKMMPFTPISIKDQINLSKYFHSDQSYFIYDTLETSPPCSKHNTMVILSDIINVNTKQLDNFPMLIRNKNKLIQPKRKRILYTTFHMEAIKDIIDSNHAMVDKNKQRKIEETKIELVKQTMLNSNKTKGEGINVTELELNGTSAEDIQIVLQKQIEEMERIKELNNNKNDNKTSNSTVKMVPFDLVRDKAKAKDELNHKIELNALGDDSIGQNETMKIDKDIPYTQAKFSTWQIFNKYKQWRLLKQKEKEELNKKSKSIVSMNKTQMMLEISQLEKDLFSYQYVLPKSDQELFKNDMTKRYDYPNIKEEIYKIPSILRSNTSDEIDDIIQAIERKTEIKHVKRSLEDIIINTSIRQKEIEEIVTNTTNEDKIESTEELKKEYKELEETKELYANLSYILKKKKEESLDDKITCQDLIDLKERINHRQEYLKHEHYEDLLERIKEENEMIESIKHKRLHEINRKKLDDIQEIDNEMERLKNEREAIESQLNNLKAREVILLRYINDIKYAEESRVELEEIRSKLQELIIKNKELLDLQKRIEKSSRIENKPIEIEKPILSSPMQLEFEATFQRNNDVNETQNNKKQGLIENGENDPFSYVRITKMKRSNDEVYVKTNNEELLKEKVAEKDLHDGQYTIYNDDNILNDPKPKEESENNNTSFIKQENFINYDEILFKESLDRLNEELANYQSNQQRKTNLRKSKQQPALTSTNNDLVLLNILKVFFNQIKSKYEFITKQNINNTSYHSYLSQDGNIMLTFDSLSLIVKYLYEIASIVEIKDGYATLLANYTDKLLQEQTNFYYNVYNYMPRLLVNYTFDNIESIAIEASRNLDKVDSLRMKQLIIYLLHNTPIALINPNDLIGDQSIIVQKSICNANPFMGPIDVCEPCSSDDLKLLLDFHPPNDNEVVILGKDQYKMYLKGNLGSIQQGVHYYEIESLELHRPTENLFGNNRKNAAMEMLLIGKDAYGKYTVVAIMISIGQDLNVFLDELGLANDITDDYYTSRLAKGEEIIIAKEEYSLINLAKILRTKDISYTSYEGKMISPPCIDNVKWYVLSNNRITLTQGQYDTFSKLLLK